MPEGWSISARGVGIKLCGGIMCLTLTNQIALFLIGYTNVGVV